MVAIFQWLVWWMDRSHDPILCPNGLGTKESEGCNKWLRLLELPGMERFHSLRHTPLRLLRRMAGEGL